MVVRPLHEMPMLESALPREAPLAIEPIEGWRCWRVDTSKPHRGPLLRSLTYRTRWPPRRAFRAHCLVQLAPQPSMVFAHSAPNAQHRCGIYALRDPGDLARWTSSSGLVAGPVRLWGSVLLYERGYIAEYAYPVAITASYDIEDDKTLWQLADTYGIELAL